MARGTTPPPLPLVLLGLFEATVLQGLLCQVRARLWQLGGRPGREEAGVVGEQLFYSHFFLSFFFSLSGEASSYFEQQSWCCHGTTRGQRVGGEKGEGKDGAGGGVFSHPSSPPFSSPLSG